jgi:hypothetical protein
VADRRTDFAGSAKSLAEIFGYVPVHPGMIGDKDRGRSRCRGSELARLSPVLGFAALAVGQRVLVQFDQVAHRLDMHRQRVAAL